VNLKKGQPAPFSGALIDFGTLKVYEDHRMGHELCKEYLLAPEKNKESNLGTFFLLTLIAGAGLVVGHNLK
jgi:hypothetical protein